MAWQVTPYTGLLVAATVVSAALALYGAFYLYTREFEPSVAAFVLLVAGVTVYALGYTLTLSSVELAAKRRWLRVVWIGASIVPTGWLVFAVTYAERESWLTRPRLALLAIQPIVTFLLLVAGIDRPMWSDFRLDTTSNPFVTVEFALGPWYQFSLLYSWMLVSAGLVVLVWFLVRSDDFYRGQTVAVVVGGVTPFLASLVFFTGLNPHPNVNPTSAAFAVSGVAYAVAVFRYRFLDVVPVATDTVVDRMRDGYIVVDDNRQVVDANPAARRFVTTSDAVGEPIEAVLPFELSAEEMPSGSDEVTDGAHEFGLGDGDRTQFVEVRQVPLAGTRRAADLLLLRDVTAQRRVERRYQRLIERASDIIVVLDNDATVRYQSPSIRRVLGHDPDDVEGENAFALVHPEDRDRVREQFEAIRDDPGATDRIEYRVRHADGDWRIIETIVKNLLEDPYVEGIVLNGRDVTDRRGRERRLERQNERLDEFAGIVSHDLRNPIQVATTSARLAEADGDPEHFERLFGALDRMERIVDDVLTLAREGRELESTEPVDLAAVANRAWDTVDTAEATIVVEESTTLDADPDRFQRLLENLFRNAVEHGPTSPDSQARRDADDAASAEPSVAGTPDDAVEHETVTVTVSALTDRRGFAVADDGPGIPESERDAVFESGYTTAAKGTGFGLAIVREIANGHGWTPRLTESDDGGARFVFVVE